MPSAKCGVLGSRVNVTPNTVHSLTRWVAALCHRCSLVAIVHLHCIAPCWGVACMYALSTALWHSPRRVAALPPALLAYITRDVSAPCMCLLLDGGAYVQYHDAAGNEVGKRLEIMTKEDYTALSTRLDGIDTTLSARLDGIDALLKKLTENDRGQDKRLDDVEALAGTVSKQKTALESVTKRVATTETGVKGVSKLSTVIDSVLEVRWLMACLCACLRW